MIYQPPLEQSDWSECYNHGRIVDSHAIILLSRWLFRPSIGIFTPRRIKWHLGKTNKPCRMRCQETKNMFSVSIIRMKTVTIIMVAIATHCAPDWIIIRQPACSSSHRIDHLNTITLGLQFVHTCTDKTCYLTRMAI